MFSRFLLRVSVVACNAQYYSILMTDTRCRRGIGRDDAVRESTSKATRYWKDFHWCERSFLHLHQDFVASAKSYSCR